jgi:hypothetical protein
MGGAAHLLYIGDSSPSDATGTGRCERRDQQEEKMSVFGSIVSAIFGSKHAAGVTGAAAPSSAPAAAPYSAPRPFPGAFPTSSAPAISQAGVEAILAKLAAEEREDFDWQRSIVDLLKLLKLDSSLGTRKRLAQELGYTGALDGSAEMNIWLQRQVLIRLGESGGKVPDSPHDSLPGDPTIPPRPPRR